MHTDPNTPKLTAVRMILRARGYTDLNEKQTSHLHALCTSDEISAVDIATIVVDSPAERTDRAVKAIRSKGSKIFGLIAKALEPEKPE